jgi:hypothetical protein
VSEGSEDTLCHPLRKTRFQPPAARAPTLKLKSRPCRSSRTRYDKAYEVFTGVSEIP